MNPMWYDEFYAIANELQLRRRFFMLNWSEIILDTLIDAVKLLPFLFLTYLAMEYIEHKMGKKTKTMVEKSGHFGPVFGAFFGAFPQCGFSTAASNLYAGKIITLGTLIAIFLSTSDEMLPILISEQVGIVIIFKLLSLKMLIGMIAGFLIDLFLRAASQMDHMNIGHMCEHEHCRCGDGIFQSALRHTIHIFLFILLITFVLNLAIGIMGEDFFADLILNRPVVGHLVAGLVGLIPNCASSVVITQLYLEGGMGLGVMMAGLLVGSGVGLFVLFRVNDNAKENVKITLLLYTIGVTAGVLLDLFGTAI